MTSLTRAPVNSSTATSAAVRARCGPRAPSAARTSARAWSRVRLSVLAGSGPTLGRAMPSAGLTAMCPRLASHAYQPETAASLRATLAADSSAASSCRAYRATCSPVTPVTGCTRSASHQASHDGARPAPRRDVIPMSLA